MIAKAYRINMRETFIKSMKSALDQHLPIVD